jgi:hypothetical protein
MGGERGVELVAGGSKVPAHGILSPRSTEGEGTVAEPPVGGSLAGVQDRVSSTRGLAAGPPVRWRGEMPQWLGVAAAALAGVAVAALVPEVQETLDEPYEPGKGTEGAPELRRLAEVESRELAAPPEAGEGFGVSAPSWLICCGLTSRPRPPSCAECRTDSLAYPEWISLG